MSVATFYYIKQGKTCQASYSFLDNIQSKAILKNLQISF